MSLVVLFWLYLLLILDIVILLLAWLKFYAMSNLQQPAYCQSTPMTATHAIHKLIWEYEKDFQENSWWDDTVLYWSQCWPISLALNKMRIFVRCGASLQPLLLSLSVAVPRLWKLTGHAQVPKFAPRILDWSLPTGTSFQVVRCLWWQILPHMTALSTA